MSTPAGWYPDPTNRHQNRWFDGNDWTDHVADGQAVSTDPVQGGPAAASTQPTPAATPDPAATSVSAGGVRAAARRPRQPATGRRRPAGRPTPGPRARPRAAAARPSSSRASAPSWLPSSSPWS